jgi:transketolase
MSSMHLVDNIRDEDIKQESIRDGFGRGLLEAGKQNEHVVGICADLTDSTKMSLFAEAFPDRFIEAGIAEQNIVTVGSGMAAMGKIPFVSSYAAFCPGRCWEQIRTTICLNEQPVKIVGSHAGLYTSPDGATHQALEDIALMRVLPHMVVLVPCDSVESEKMAAAMTADSRPNYIRLARGASPVITTAKTPFAIGPAYIFKEGTDVTLVATGTMTYQAMVAADILAKDGISAEVIHVPTIKPFDADTIVASAKKTGAVVVAEEGQINAGLAGAVAEVLGEQAPTPLRRIGMKDAFGQSAKDPSELLKHYGLDSGHIAMAAHELFANRQK